MDYKIKEETLSGIADAIRSKSGSSEAIKVSEFAEQIGTISTGSDIELLENMQIPVDFSEGNQYIDAPEGTAVKSAVIQKPENLKAENIAKGINVAGIVGTQPTYEILRNVPIDLDFSEGNQYIEPPEGQAVESAIIQKPENLIPENIAEGIDIAGIIGTLTAGGGGGNAKVATGTIIGKGIDAPQTVNHNLGVMPNIVIVMPLNYVAPQNQEVGLAVGFSSEYAKAIGSRYEGINIKKTSNNDITTIPNAYMETTSTTDCIYKANSTSFTIDDLTLNRNYAWIAISGLT